jgi:vanillate O-demethylase monooxygenase subunit
MFAKNCWYMATDKEDVLQKPLALKVAGEDIVLYRDSGNRIIAMADLCPHRMAPLSMGRVEGDDLRCMYHGIRFGSDGRCKEVPGQEFVPEIFCVKKYAVYEGFEWVWVWIGDQTKADEALVPDQHFHNPKFFNVRKGSVRFDASYELFNDNTCDLSHVAYVHEKTFSATGGEEWAQKQPVITLHERHVQVDRWMVGISHPLFPDQKVDFTTRFKHVLPGVFIMDIQTHPHGTAEKLAYGAPPEEMRPLNQSGTIQTMRAITETTSHFYFSIVAPHWVPQELLDADFEFGKTGFVEDKAMCEAQQRMISSHPEERLRQTVHDRAGAHIRKLIRATHNEAAA